MSPYQFFGLTRPAFDAKPDPRVFFETAGHRETRATLEYALFAAKPCTVVIGESGLGKTLLARLTAADASANQTVIWTNGIGQEPGRTDIRVFSPGELATSGNEKTGEAATLAEWTRSLPAPGRAPLVIVDDADALPEPNWHALLGLLARDVEFPHPPTLAVFGHPRLLKELSSPVLTRLRRRVFRTCILHALRPDEVREYVQYRLARAAGTEDIAVFTDDALSHVARLTRGNPSLINQVCENAMLEAFGQESTTVEAPHVVSAARALTGAQSLLTAPQTRPVSFGRHAARALLPPEPREEAAPQDEGDAHADVIDVPATVGAPPPSTAVESAQIPDDEDQDPGDEPDTVEKRLWQLEARLANTISIVRKVRAHSTEGQRDGDRSAAAAPEPAIGKSS
jgi:MSHA biogenesis protein MshM